MPDFLTFLPAADADRLDELLNLGRALWALAYGAIAWVGLRSRSYGMPMVACCLTLSWEIIFSFTYTFSDPKTLLWFKLWFVLDLAIFVELFIFGKKEQKNPVIKTFFYFVLLTTLAFAYIGERTFFSNVATPNNLSSMQATMTMLAYMVNLTASILFSFLLFSRPDLKGLSYLAAWAKSLGTVCISIVNLVALTTVPGIFPAPDAAAAQANKWLWPEYYMYFLMFAVTFYDVIYIALFTRAKFFSSDEGSEAKATPAISSSSSRSPGKSA